MFFSRGLGLLALLIPVAFQLVAITLFGHGGNGSYELFLLALLASGPVVFIAGFVLDRAAGRRRWLLGTAARLSPEQRPRRFHDLYFASLRFWGLLWTGVASGLWLYHHLA